MTTSLSGLKQSPLAWYQRHVTHYFQQGFSQTESNANIYVKKILKEVSLFWQFIMWRIALLLAIIWRWHVMHLSGHKCSLMSHHDKINLNQSPYQANLSEDCQNQCDILVLPWSLCRHQFGRIEFLCWSQHTSQLCCNKKIKAVFTATIY